MAEQILKVTLLLSSWRRGKGEWQAVQSTLPQRKIEHRATVSCLVQWHTQDSFWPLRNVVATCHKSLKTATHFFAKCFQGGSWDRARCHLLGVISFPLLLLYLCLGREPRSGHFDISQPPSCAAPYSHRTLVPTPVPVLAQLLSICWAWQPSPKTLSLSMCPCFRSAARDCLLCSRARDSLYFWSVLVAIISPKPHTSVPAPHLKWCHELHLLIMLKVHSHGPPLPQVSLLRAYLAPGTLPCYLPSHHAWFPSSSQPLSFTPPCLLCLQNSTGATAPQCCPACPATSLGPGP